MADNTVFLFPGQGSQSPGMGLALFEKFSESRAVFETADRVLGFPLSRLCFEGPEDQLKLTENTQPAILTVSIAAFRALAARGLTPRYVAGHSLGEYSALVAAGALTLEDALVAVRRRGRYMQEAVPVGTGAMAAILGMDADTLGAVCREAEQGEVVAPANFNASNQIVIAGHAAAVERAMRLAKERGAKRAIPLPVSAPFHCALMRPAQERLREDLDKIPFATANCVVVNNVDAAPVTDPADLRDGLFRQVPSPVRWQESMTRLLGLGADVFVEVGPGKVLTGLLKKLSDNIRTYNVEDPAGLEFVCQELTR